MLLNGTMEMVSGKIRDRVSPPPPSSLEMNELGSEFFQ